MNALEILQDIWSRTPGPFVFLPQMERKPDGSKSWFEDHAWNPDNLTELPPQEWGMDMYFTPLRLRQTKRAEEWAPLESSVLFADLDRVNPRTELPPHIAWSTSPGSYQGVWFLTEAVPIPEWRRMNQALTYKIGADKGGWFPSKVLRIPTTLNWKRAEADPADGSLYVPRGSVLWTQQSEPYSPGTIRGWVSDAVIPGEGTHSGDFPPVPSLAGEFISEAGLSRSTLIALETEGKDRSAHIWNLARKMCREGMAREMAFNLIWGSTAGSKYREQRRPGRLWKDVCKAYESVTVRV